MTRYRLWSSRPDRLLRRELISTRFVCIERPARLRQTRRRDRIPSDRTASAGNDRCACSLVTVFAAFRDDYEALAQTSPLNPSNQLGQRRLSVPAPAPGLALAASGLWMFRAVIRRKADRHFRLCRRRCSSNQCRRSDGLLRAPPLQMVCEVSWDIAPHSDTGRRQSGSGNSAKRSLNARKTSYRQIRRAEPLYFSIFPRNGSSARNEHFLSTTLEVTCINGLSLEPVGRHSGGR